LWWSKVWERAKPLGLTRSQSDFLHHKRAFFCYGSLRAASKPLGLTWCKLKIRGCKTSKRRICFCFFASSKN
jgi:hypothetical protein